MIYISSGFLNFTFNSLEIIASVEEKVFPRQLELILCRRINMADRYSSLCSGGEEKFYIIYIWARYGLINLLCQKVAIFQDNNFIVSSKIFFWRYELAGECKKTLTREKCYLTITLTLFCNNHNFYGIGRGEWGLFLENFCRKRRWRTLL